MEQSNAGGSRFTRQAGKLAAEVLASGLCYFFANSLRGGFGFLMWVAPVWLISFSLHVELRKAFLAAFISYLIGRLSWFSYLVSVASLIPAIFITILLALVFAIIIISVRKIVVATNAWYAVFAFPALFTGFEFLLLIFSPDGSAGSIAYSQSNYLPIVQLASITGILGITFLLTLIPSCLAMAWYFKKDKFRQRMSLGVGALFLILNFLFGIERLSGKIAYSSLKVGLVLLDEKYHDITRKPDFRKEKITAALYAGEASGLASRGAKIIVLPERAMNITAETEKELVGRLCESAKQNKVFIISGVTNFRADPLRNSALVIDSNGQVIAEYNKAHLIRGLEDQFTSGTAKRIFAVANLNAGTAICKDLDFPEYIASYHGVAFLAIPAWDFSRDAWLHSRMAVLRGVENGFSEIRVARQGRLTISDDCGRIISEADGSDGRAVNLLGEMPIRQSNTLYSRFGNWFGIVNLTGLGILLWATLKRRSS